MRGLYAGCTALVIGNSVKAGVRFVSYDRFKQALADKDVNIRSFILSLLEFTICMGNQGKVSAPRSLLAGLGAGVMEAIFAVTPSETIK